MSLCWSCERDAGAGLVCLHCGALTAPSPGETYFAVLGLPVRYGLDLVAAEAAFKDRTRLVHPDRFAKADPRARQLSLRRTVTLNEAWRTIKHPVRRAEYLMRLLGYDLAGESGATGPGGAARAAGVAPERTRLAVSPVLLNEVLELQEALLEARASGDAAAVRRLAGEVQGRLVDALASVARGLAGRADAMQPAREGDGDMLVVDTFAEKKEELDAVAEQLIAIRYLQRFLDEIDASAPQDEAAPPAASGGVPTPPGSA